MAPVNADEPAIARFDLAHALTASAVKARVWAGIWSRLAGQTWRADRQYATADALDVLAARVLDGTLTAGDLDTEARALLAAIPDLPDEFLTKGTES